MDPVVEMDLIGVRRASINMTFASQHVDGTPQTTPLQQIHRSKHPFPGLTGAARQSAVDEFMDWVSYKCSNRHHPPTYMYNNSSPISSSSLLACAFGMESFSLVFFVCAGGPA